MLAVNPFSAEAMRMAERFESSENVPERIFQLAREMIEGEKDAVSRGRQKTPLRTQPTDAKEDLLTLHLLLRTVAARYGYPSAEGRAVVELVKRSVKSRVWEELNRSYQKSAKGYRDDAVLMLFADILRPVPIGMVGGEQHARDAEGYSNSREEKDAPRYALDKDRLIPLLRGTDRKLTDLYLFNGYIAASISEMVDYYCEAIGSRAIETLSKSWQFNDSRASELAGLVAQIPRGFQRNYAPFMRGGQGSGGRPLIVDHFPPCIRHTLDGVTTCSRNYAITVLLTSFLSYARIAPIGSSKDAKVSDYITDISAVASEILPLIEEAAKHCEPPLFDDQPMERMNVIYHLGLGLTPEPKLEDAGKSNWYFPPNCDKIQREAPSLCTPDAHCKTIKNPLSYYAKKLFPPKQKGKEDEQKLKGMPKIAGEKLVGEIVEVQDGSGLIQRCPKCDRWIIDNFCIVHSDVEGIWDLRIKAKFMHDGKSSDLIFKREATEQAVNFALEEAMKLGAAATLDRIKGTLIGKNFEITGKKLTKNFIVSSIREV